jgi:hypothetical protein
MNKDEKDNATALTTLDVIFISYDEPNADENYADLLAKVPWAKRVHGVEGSDAAHKAAAQLSETDRFIGVDADNIVDVRFFDQEINFEHEKFKDKVISWSATNAINALEYGNGGLKCWPVEYVMNMRTHEAADPNDPNGQVDFCWADTYVQMNNCFCTTYNNGSPLQAFRAGFREGVKMSLDRGDRVEPENFRKQIWHGNYTRLLVWATVGADVPNGLWAIYGTRLGCYLTTLTDWDFVQVRDFEYLNEYWAEHVAPRFELEGSDHKCYKTGYSWDNNLLLNEIKDLGNRLRKGLDMEIAEFDEDASKFFKATYTGLPRTGKYVTEAEMNELREINK